MHTDTHTQTDMSTLTATIINSHHGCSIVTYDGIKPPGPTNMECKVDIKTGNFK